MEPMRILIDSNVFISALIAEGNEKRVIEHIIASGNTIILTDLINREIGLVLSRKLSSRQTSSAKNAWREFQEDKKIYMKRKHQYQQLLAKSRLLINQKDAPILAAGLQQEVDAIISGDKHFIENSKLRYLRRKKIFTAREMLAIL